MSEFTRCARCEYFSFLNEPCWQCGAPVGERDLAKARRQVIVWVLIAFVLTLLAIDVIVNRLNL